MPTAHKTVSSTHVRAVLWWREAIRWAGEAPYDSPGALADAIARLAGEAGAPAFQEVLAKLFTRWAANFPGRPAPAAAPAPASGGGS